MSFSRPLNVSDETGVRAVSCNGDVKTERHRSRAISVTATTVSRAVSTLVNEKDEFEGTTAGEKAVGAESRKADTKMGRRVNSNASGSLGSPCATTEAEPETRRSCATSEIDDNGKKLFVSRSVDEVNLRSPAETSYSSSCHSKLGSVFFSWRATNAR